VGLLNVASALQGDKPECDTIVLGFQSPWLYRGGGPLDSVAGASHDGGVLALESDSAMGAAAVGGTPARAELTAGAPSS
jgi:hypothetical protein